MKRYLIAVLIVILTLVAGCGKEEPKRPGPVTLTASNDGYQSTIKIDPAVVGPNTFTVTILDGHNKAIVNGQATLHFSMSSHEHGETDHGKSVLELASRPEGNWFGEGPHLMMNGTWQISLVWKDSDGKGHSFDYTLTLV